jgi:hypothetical protein
MWRAERPLPTQPAVETGSGVDQGDFNSFGFGERRLESVEPTGQHRLSAPRRAVEQKVVTPGGCYLDGTSCHRLTPNLSHVTGFGDAVLRLR